jgi:hypothetical protein
MKVADTSGSPGSGLTNGITSPAQDLSRLHNSSPLVPDRESQATLHQGISIFKRGSVDHRMARGLTKPLPFCNFPAYRRTRPAAGPQSRCCSTRALQHTCLPSCCWQKAGHERSLLFELRVCITISFCLNARAASSSVCFAPAYEACRLSRLCQSLPS